ncbi:MAG TPA: glycerol kinase GlpK [Thermoanaerobaculia bacterium]|nr:glycerol kinase GlpK [Thermoanaerobaculia bacterium]
MQAILALDQGTTSSRAILFDAAGSVLAVAQREFRQIFPQPGWVEHDADEIWTTQIEVAAEAIARAGVVEIAAIGITNQRETTVLWDRATGRPLSNAIVWQDRRTAETCEQLEAAGHKELFRARTGLVIDPYFSGTKIRWLLDNIDGARDRAEAGELAAGTIDCWLLWNLTGGRLHATDVTNASRTLLFDIHRATWDDQLLDLLEVPRSLLPEVLPSSGIFGETAKGLPIPAGIPIAGVAGDQQAALFGQRCVAPGMAKNTYGTGSFVVLNTGSSVARSIRGILSTVAWQIAGSPIEYAIEGSIFITGAAVQWLRDGLGIIDSAAEVERLAGSVPDSGGVVFVPAFTGLGTPHWDPHARGTILGITRGTTAAHLARATLEAIAMQSAEVLEAMHLDSGIAIRELRVDGGGSTNDLLMQIQADLAGIPVLRTRVSETTALGVAYLAGLATGVWRSQEEIDAQWSVDRRFEPSLDASRRLELRDRWLRAIERARGWR